MPEVEAVVALLAAVVGLGVLARHLTVPYPILLVLGGLALGFVPGLPRVELEPETVFLVFLPPLLYVAAIFTSFREFRAKLRPIGLLAVGLVACTTLVVAVVARAVVDDLPWAAALVLGAVVSPTDAVAATAIAQRLGVPRRIVTVLEGESLVNDATGIVAYRVAVAAVVGGGTLSLGGAAAQLVVNAAGGVAVGLAVGVAVAWVRRRLPDDPPLENTVSLLTPFVAYLPAERLHASGVLAVVTTGLWLGWRGPTLVRPAARLQGYGMWEVVSFLLNGLVFVLIGLQLRGVVEGLGERSAGSVAGAAVAVCAAAVVVRVAWVFATVYVPRWASGRVRRREPPPSARQATVIAWAGMRGVISLAAALALPLTTDAGAPFPGRDLIVFLTFCVILFTLVGEGLTLPVLIRALDLRDDGQVVHQEVAGRAEVARAAVERLGELESEDWVRKDTAERVRGLYEFRRRRFEARARTRASADGADGAADGGEDIEARSADYQRLLRELLDAQRAAVVRLRNEGRLNDDALHRIERDLDLEEARLDV